MLRRLTTAAACTALLAAIPAIAAAANPSDTSSEAGANAQLSQAIAPDATGQPGTGAQATNQPGTAAQANSSGTQLAAVPYDGRGLDTKNRASVIEGFQSTFGRLGGIVPRVTGQDLDRCITGAPNPDDIRAYVAIWNYQRSLAGLSMLQPVTSGPYIQAAHEAAMIMSANNKLSHYPERDGFRCITDAGKAGAGASNIALGYGTLGSMASGFANDSGVKNDPVGHRRWLLNPPLTQGAVGFSDYGRTTAQIVLDIGTANSPRTLFQGETTVPEFVAWPSPGYFPAPLFPTTEADKWSFSAYSAGFATPDLSNATATITGPDGRTIPITKTLNPSSNTLVFHTAPHREWTMLDGPDMRLHVRIDGVRNAACSSYEYDVILVDPYPITTEVNQYWIEKAADPAREPVLIDACQITNTCQYFLTDGWTGDATSSYTFGDARAPLYVGDWDGDGSDTPGVRRP